MFVRERKCRGTGVVSCLLGVQVCRNLEEEEEEEEEEEGIDFSLSWPTVV